MPMSLSTFLGTDTPTPLHGGHQALVFDAGDVSGERRIAKLRRQVDVNATILEERMRAVAKLASTDARVCSPLMVGDGFVAEVAIDGELMLGTLHEYAHGEALDHTYAGDATVMGTELATLHDSLQLLPEFSLPFVPALSASGYERGTASIQLLHGDFSGQNLRRDGGSISIFDFDDSGYGPREFDVANSLYMVLFDDMTHQDLDVYEQFRAAFLDGYSTASARAPFDDETLNGLIDMRVNALGAWLDEPSTAPAGVRNSTPQWHRTLREFIERYWAART